MASGELFMQAAGPKDLDTVEGGSRSEYKVKARVAGGEIASSRAHFIHLTFDAGGDRDSCTNAHPITLRAHQAQRDPVVAIPGLVEKERRRSASVEDEDVEFSIIID